MTGLTEREIVEAWQRRDASYDGLFVLAVKTTGIFCRPSCPSQPKRESLEFLAFTGAAVRAGYRPCTRFRPALVVDCSEDDGRRSRNSAFRSGRLPATKRSHAVARANGTNRLYLLVPCHRVIAKDGSLSGYGGGVWRKQRLLDLERTGSI